MSEAVRTDITKQLIDAGLLPLLPLPPIEAVTASTAGPKVSVGYAPRARAAIQ